MLLEGSKEASFFEFSISGNRTIGRSLLVLVTRIIIFFYACRVEVMVVVV